jgi:hypothetical protein
VPRAPPPRDPGRHRATFDAHPQLRPRPQHLPFDPNEGAELAVLDAALNGLHAQVKLTGDLSEGQELAANLRRELEALRESLLFPGRNLSNT